MEETTFTGWNKRQRGFQIKVVTIYLGGHVGCENAFIPPKSDATPGPIKRVGLLGDKMTYLFAICMTSAPNNDLSNSAEETPFARGMNRFPEVIAR